VNLQKVRRRIRSAKATVKLTRAMEAVARMKLSRSLSFWRGASPYADGVEELLRELKVRREELESLPYTRRRSGREYLVLLGSERGLCGGFNTVLRDRVRERDRFEGLMVVGSKLGRRFPAGTPTLKGVVKVEEVERVVDRLFPEIRRRYGEGYDIVVLPYRYHPGKPRAEYTPFLPVELAVEEYQGESEYEIFHDRMETLAYLLERAVRSKLVKLLVENFCAEQEFRTFAMKNATENGKELIKSLSLSYHKMRQRRITDEIADVVRGTEGGVE